VAVDRVRRTIGDISDEMMRFTRTVVLRALLGGDLGAVRHEDRSGMGRDQREHRQQLLVVGHRRTVFQRARARQFAEARIVLRQAVRLRDQRTPSPSH
jgi:hypothetical protein